VARKIKKSARFETVSPPLDPDGDPNASLFERSLAFWEHLRLIFESTDHEKEGI
jgi:hypothetical protein